MSALSFGVLGPLEVTSGGLDVAVRGRMPRALLATLLLSANRAVSTDTLVDTLWPGVPPRSAVANLRTYACLLRGQLSAGSPYAAPRILTRPAGYTLAVAPDELDLTAFESLAGQARRARSAGQQRQALQLLEQALGLWRGRLLEDLPQRVTWETTAACLAGLRTSLVELAVEIRVELGQHAAAAADLRGLLATDPLHEGWWRGLIQALHACGRTAEALQAYGEARRMLADELGVNPGSHLRSAVALVLDDTRLPAPEPAAAICQLPMDPPDFVGRREAVEELTGRLDELRAGNVAVRDSVERSYRLLPDRAARAFGLLALLGPDPLPAWTVAALAGPSGRDEVVDAMVDANLLQLVGTDRAGQARYRLPDLLRCYAADRAHEHPAAEQAAALRRVLDGWLALATRARDRMPIRYFGVTPAGGVPRGMDSGLAERLTADPAAWFEAERHCLATAVELAVRAGRAGHAWRLAAAMAPFFDLRGHYDEWQRVHEVALERARRAGAVLGEAVLLRDLGQLYIYRDRYDAAAAAFATARARFASLGDVRGVGLARCGQGTVHRVRGHNRRALAVYRQALDLFVQAGDRHSEAVVRSAIGRAHQALNHHAEARRWLTEAYELAVALGDRHREALGLHRLTLLDRKGGTPVRVEADMRRALEMLDDLGDEHCAANVRQSIGEFHFRHGDPAKAGGWLAESLRAYQRLGDRRAEATVTALLGEWHGGAGRIRPAQAYLSRALETWRQLAAPRQAAAVSATLRALR